MGRRSGDWWPLAVFGSVLGLGTAFVAVAIAVARIFEAKEATNQNESDEENKTGRQGKFWDTITDIGKTVIGVIV